MELPLTPADFALGETRFKKHFQPLKGDADGVPMAEYIDARSRQRARARHRSSGRQTPIGAW